MIRKVKAGYKVVSSKGKNLGGPYKTEEEAKKRLRQVESKPKKFFFFFFGRACFGFIPKKKFGLKGKPKCHDLCSQPANKAI